MPSGMMAKAIASGPPGLVSTRRHVAAQTFSVPLWVQTRLDAHIIRTRDTDGDLSFIILIPGSDNCFSIRVSGEANASYKGEMLANVGKLISELKAFAKAIEELPSEEVEL